MLERLTRGWGALRSMAIAFQSPFGKGITPVGFVTMPMCTGGIGGRVFQDL